MTNRPNLTEATVRRLATAQSFERGEDYYYRSAVYDIVRRGDTLQTEVEGSQYEPYQVTIELDAAGITSTYCSCPYDWGGVCKHIVAVLPIPSLSRVRPTATTTLCAGWTRSAAPPRRPANSTSGAPPSRRSAGTTAASTS